MCDFLIHPSMKTDQHKCFAGKIGNYLNEIAHSCDELETREAFQTAYIFSKKQSLKLRRLISCMISLSGKSKTTGLKSLC